MTRRLIVNAETCTECRSCELKCSFVHFEVFNPNKSGVRIVSDWPELPRARLCIQCADPACLPACPFDALERTDEGTVRVVYEACTGCCECVEACPYDGVWLDPSSGVAVKCDTCDGRFECIASCLVGALSVEE